MLALEHRGGTPLVIGHRGAPAVAPENTLPAFRAAVAAGVDLVEFDVLGLSGGELVVAHSHDLDEVSHGATPGTLLGLTLAEAREVAPDLPTLDEALRYFVEEAPRVGVHIDLKELTAAEDLVAALRRFALVERTLVTTFHWSALRRIRRAEPGLRTGVSFPEDKYSISKRRGSGRPIRIGLHVLRPLMPLVARLLLGRSGASTLVLHHTLVGPALVRWAHARGVPVVAWTVDDPRDMERLGGVGVDAVVVNNPAMFVSTLPA